MTAVASSDLATFLAQKLSNYVEPDQVGQLAEVLSQGITEFQSQSGGKKSSKRKGSEASGRPKKFKSLTPYHQFVACWMLLHPVTEGSGNGKSQSQERMTTIGADWKALPEAQRAEYTTYATRFNEYVERAVAGRSFDVVPKQERETLYEGAGTYAYEGSRFSTLLHSKRERDVATAAAKKTATATATSTATSTVSTVVPPSVVSAPAPAPVAVAQPVAVPATTTTTTTRRGAGRR